ncbi:MAG: hypothetical protein H0T76_18740 [Nannocystis sp.]|nr:hypothetical protein [Nannocystis sp.]MBA3548525.1 hypothetical protein [Nannocystis sp.]
MCTLLAVAGACDAEVAEVAEVATVDLADEPVDLADESADLADESAEPAEPDALEVLRAEIGGSAMGVTVNAIEFMRNTSSMKRLLLDPSRSVQTATLRCTPEVSYSESMNAKVGDFTHNIIRYVKSPDGAKWEQYNSDGSKIWLERDTSWPIKDAGGNNTAGYDAKPFGSLTWAANNWTEGSQLPYNTRIAGFNWDPAKDDRCRYETPSFSDYDFYGYKTFSYHPAKDWGGAVGKVDSIAVDYYIQTYLPASGTNEVRLGERHWYARGQGWVSWEHYNRDTNTHEQTCVWNANGGPPTAPQIHCNGVLGDRALGFLGKSFQMTYNYGDWDNCHYKATCNVGQGIQGLSRAQAGPGSQRMAVCAQPYGGSNVYTGEGRAVLKLPYDQRRAQRQVNGNADWDFGHWKLECGADEYVAGVSQGAQVCNTGEGNFHGLVCAGGNAARLTQKCNTRVFNGYNDSRATLSSGDWDKGAYKAECGTREYLAGVSVNPSTYRVHALLCCERT